MILVNLRVNRITPSTSVYTVTKNCAPLIEEPTKSFQSCDPPVCTTCKSGDIVREASCFCKDCGEYLCNACKTGHLKFKKLRGHIIIDVKEQGKHGDKS